MTLGDLYTLLINGELAQHPMIVAATDDDAETEIDYKIIDDAVQMGLDDLHSRFPLKMQQLTLIMSDRLSTYPLTREHALSNPTKVIKFIDDGLYPFRGDLLRVVGIYDEGGCNIDINNNNCCGGVFLTEYNVLTIPNPVNNDALFITYLAKHPDIRNTSADARIDLPTSLLPALCSYVAYRLYSGFTQEVAGMKATALLSQYELSCQQQDMFGMTNRNNGTPVNFFEAGGWA